MQQNASAEPTTGTPTQISVILATYNEARFVERAIVSILNQHTTCADGSGFELEILAVDGMSTDGTREALEHFAATDSRLRVVENHKRYTPFAFNLGLQQARGEYVCIFGSHSVYSRDYVAVCLAELLTRDAAACGGRVLTAPANKTLSARFSAWTLSHRFGSSGRSFRTQPEGPVDTVNYPLMRRADAIAAGGYDEELTRNQDNDLNQRLRAAGKVLWCTWKTQCLYFPQATVKGLLRYGFKNGYWNVLSLVKNPSAMAPRHFVPLAFVLCVLLASGVAAAGAQSSGPYAAACLLPLAVVLGAHLCLGAASALQVAVRERAPAALCLPAVFLGFHLAYGLGTLSGMAGLLGSLFRTRKQPRPRSVPFAD